MNYCAIRRADIADGVGFRVSLFVSGCHFHCPGCFNKNAWDEECGKPFTEATKAHILDLLNKPYIKGLTLLGGEPFESGHISALKDLVLAVRSRFPDKNVWAYSGYTFEELLKDSDKLELLKLCDVLVDGRFEEDKKDLSLAFRGSSNQRIIVVKEKLKNGDQTSS